MREVECRTFRITVTLSAARQVALLDPRLTSYHLDLRAATLIHLTTVILSAARQITPLGIAPKGPIFKECPLRRVLMPQLHYRLDLRAATLIHLKL